MPWHWTIGWEGVSGLFAAAVAIQFVAAFGLASGAQQTEPRSSAFLVGPQLQKRLGEVVTVSFVDQPFRQAIRSFSKSYQVAVMLDRRLDPDRLVSLSVRDRPVGELLVSLAAAGGGEVCWMGPVAYVGPPEKAWHVLAAAEMCQQVVEQFPSRERIRWQETSAMAWPDFASPRELLVDLARQLDWQLLQPELIPHDLWPGMELPPLAMAEKLALLTVPFEMRPVPDVSRRTIQLREFEPNLRWQRSYPWPIPPLASSEALRKLIPAAQWEIRGRVLFVTGTWPEHRALIELAKPSPGRAPPAGKTAGERRYTIRNAKGRFESVMRQLAAALGLEIRFDQEALARAGIAPDTFISFSVENATREELLEAATGAAGCSFRIEGNVLVIFPLKR